MTKLLKLPVTTSSVLTVMSGSGPGQRVPGPVAPDPASPGASERVPEPGLALQPGGGVQAERQARLSTAAGLSM